MNGITKFIKNNLTAIIYFAVVTVVVILVFGIKFDFQVKQLYGDIYDKPIIDFTFSDALSLFLWMLVFWVFVRK